MTSMPTACSRTCGLFQIFMMYSSKGLIVISGMTPPRITQLMRTLLRVPLQSSDRRHGVKTSLDDVQLKSQTPLDPQYNTSSQSCVAQFICFFGRLFPSTAGLRQALFVLKICRVLRRKPFQAGVSMHEFSQTVAHDGGPFRCRCVWCLACACAQQHTAHVRVQEIDCDCGSTAAEVGTVSP